MFFFPEFLLGTPLSIPLKIPHGIFFANFVKSSGNSTEKSCGNPTEKSCGDSSGNHSEKPVDNSESLSEYLMNISLEIHLEIFLGIPIDTLLGIRLDIAMEFSLTSLLNHSLGNSTVISTGNSSSLFFSGNTPINRWRNLAENSCEYFSVNFLSFRWKCLWKFLWKFLMIFLLKFH